MTMTAPSNGTITIPSGASITKIGCSGVNGQKPDGCTGTNFTSSTSGGASSSSVLISSSSIASSSSAGGTPVEISAGTTLTKNTTYKITGCDKGGSRIQLNNAKFQNCLDIFGTDGTYWYNNTNDCGGEIFVSYPIVVTTPSVDVVIGGCGN